MFLRFIGTLIKLMQATLIDTDFIKYSAKISVGTSVLSACYYFYEKPWGTLIILNPTLYTIHFSLCFCDLLAR